MHKPIFQHLKHSIRNNTIALIQWIVISLFIGNVVGLVGVAFHKMLELATEYRIQYPWLLFAMPVAGFLIVGLYKVTGMENDHGTETVIASVRQGVLVRIVMAPLIFVSTILTHLVGGSAGREGAALQLGGSIGGFFGRVLGLDERDQRVMTMTGMSTGFSALFGTPLSAAVFSMEVESVGVMYYAALVPCMLGALTARQVSEWFGIHAHSYVMTGIPNFVDLKTSFSLIIFGIFCGIIANVFCRTLDFFRVAYKKAAPNPWIRVLLGSVIVIGLTLLIGNRDYNGAGMDVIERAIKGQAFGCAFLIKMLLTALTLNAGFKGGEIVPTLFIGATFGCVVGPLVGLESTFAAAVGMVSVFCGVTNAPLTSILMSYELFGGNSLVLVALAISVSFMTSGYHSLYHEQKIVYSKIKAKFIDIASCDDIEE